MEALRPTLDRLQEHVRESIAVACYRKLASSQDTQQAGRLKRKLIEARNHVAARVSLCVYDKGTIAARHVRFRVEALIHHLVDEGGVEAFLSRCARDFAVYLHFFSQQAKMYSLHPRGTFKQHLEKQYRSHHVRPGRSIENLSSDFAAWLCKGFPGGETIGNRLKPSVEKEVRKLINGFGTMRVFHQVVRFVEKQADHPHRTDSDEKADSPPATQLPAGIGDVIEQLPSYLEQRQSVHGYKLPRKGTARIRCGAKWLHRLPGVRDKLFNTTPLPKIMDNPYPYIRKTLESLIRNGQRGDSPREVMPMSQANEALERFAQRYGGRLAAWAVRKSPGLGKAVYSLCNDAVLREELARIVALNLLQVANAARPDRRAA